MTSEIAQLRQDMVRMGRLLFERGLSNGSAGNLSLRGPDNTFLVTPTGCTLSDLDADSLSLLNAQGELISGAKPTKEYPFHLAFYKLNAQVNAVVHTHSPYATAYACLDHSQADPENVLRPITPYLVMKLGHVILTPYRKPGSRAIADDIASHGPDSKAFLLANHGMVTGGKNAADALNNAVELEESCRLFFITQGCALRHLTAEEIKELL